ncbi:MAG: hypothetical protein OEY23_09135 [Acidimicrobiia bacterium]|nr:hypothetical protein [Acidimicrobiia bacterium]
MPVTFVDPRAEPGRPVEPYALAIDLRAGPVTVGLLANGFPDSVAFLDQVQAALGQTLPNLAFRRYDKGNASIVAPDALVEQIRSECDAVIAAYGH